MALTVITFPIGLCFDVLVDVCNIGCADFTINDVTSSSLCQVACNANAEYKSWTFDKAYQVNIKKYYLEKWLDL